MYSFNTVMNNTTVFMVTRFGLHPGHRQTYTLLRTYEKPYKGPYIKAGKEMSFTHINITSLVKNNVKLDKKNNWTLKNKSA